MWECERGRGRVEEHTGVMSWGYGDEGRERKESMGGRGILELRAETRSLRKASAGPGLVAASVPGC